MTGFIKNPTASLLAYGGNFNQGNSILSGSGQFPTGNFVPSFTASTPMPTVWDASYGGILRNDSSVMPTVEAYAPGGNLPSVNQFASAAGNGDSNFLGLSQNSWGNLGQGIMGAYNIYSGLQANKLAKQQLAFAKQQYATNLANSIKSYNTQLADKINSRYAVEGKASADAAAYLEANKL